MSKTVFDLDPDQLADVGKGMSEVLAEGLKELYGIDKAPQIIIGFADPENDKGLICGAASPQAIMQVKKVFDVISEQGGLKELWAEAKEKGSAVLTKETKREIH